MEQTAAYQLNQWEKSDRIMREDFNADNAKVEAALQDVAARYPLVYLKHAEATEGAKQVDLDVSDLDLSEYLVLYIYVRFTASCAAKYMGVRVNGLSTGYEDSDGGTNNNRMSSATLSTDIGGASATLSVGKYLKATNCAPVTTAEVTSINVAGLGSTLTSSATLAADTQVWLYGLKRC